MNACQRTQALLFEKADGRIADATRAELEAHLAACPPCRQVFAAWGAALPRLRALPLEEPSAVSVRRMENEVLRQLQVAPAPRGRRVQWLAVAASLILVAGGTAIALRAPTPRPFARIETLRGRVTLSGAALDRGAVMGPGGVLDIAGEGEAAFGVGRAAEVHLFGPARVTLDGTLTEPRLRLDSGRLAVDIAHRQGGESFTVATRHGRVEVRGTRFSVGYDARGSYVHVDQGEVAAFRAGVAAPSAVKAGETFSLAPEAPPPAPADRAPAEPAPRLCPKSSCAEAGARARRAMRVGNPTRAIELVDEAVAAAAGCPLEARCRDELGYLRAEGLRQAGRIDAAVVAYQALNRPGATRAMRQNALYAAAQLERQLGRSAEARQTFEQALAASPEGALAEETLAALLELLPPRSAEARATAVRYLARHPQGVAAARARRMLSDAPLRASP